MSIPAELDKNQTFHHDSQYPVSNPLLGQLKCDQMGLDDQEKRVSLSIF